MRKSISAVSLAVTIVMSLGVASAHGGGILPPTSGRNLNDLAVNLPADLPAEPTVVVMTFDQDQQGQADRWIKGLQKLKPNVEWMELAIIGPVNAFVRGMITAGMRRETPDGARRARFVTVFITPAPFTQSLGCLMKLKSVCVAVVNRSGQVLAVVSEDFGIDRAQPILEQLMP